MNALIPIDPPTEFTTCTIHLHGRLKTDFGPEIVVPASTVSVAIRNMLIRKPRMRMVLEAGEYRVVRGSLDGGIDLDETQLHMRIGPSRQLHLFPVAAGGGGNHGGTLKVVLGAVLVVAAIATVIAAPELSQVYAGALTSAAGTIGLFGASLILSGISRLISPQPGLGASYLLNGNFNTALQGTPVPLVYGQTRVGSVVVASSYSAEDYTTSTSDYEGAGAYWNASGGFSGYLDAFDTGNPLPAGASGKGGGGKSGGGSGGVVAPNTLESKAIVTIIDVLSEGPILGLVNGPQGIFFNNTPLMNADGSWNFRGVTWYVFYGTPDQPALPGFPSATETITFGEQVFFGNPVIQQLQSTTANQARVTVEVPALYATNTQNGDVNPSSLTLTIEVAEVVGTAVGAYSVVVDDTIQGMASSPYQRSYVFNLPGAQTGSTPIIAWNVRVTKLTQESAVSTTVNTLYWYSYDYITNNLIGYEDTAYIALSIDSEAFGSSLPSRTYLIDGITVQVPANYNAATLAYNSSGPGTIGGSWDYATFSPQQTGNPAWILYDFLSNARYGLGLSTANLETIAVQLYEISQYCDGLVPDGNGVTEPRYRLNGVFNQRTDAFKMMQAIAATFRGQVYWAGGQVCVTADMPQNPVKIYTAANVIGGNFVYEGTSLKTRHTFVNAHFTDPSNQYLPGIETTELPAQVAQRGIFTADIVGFGVTSRGLAHRLGNWLLYTENFQTETVTFSVGWDSAGLMPGNLIQVADPSVAGIRLGGRLRSTSTSQALALDMQFTPVAGQSYSASIILRDGTLAQAVEIASFSDVTPSAPPYTFYENFTDESAIASPLLEFARASSATYLNSAGILAQAGVNQPRFDYSTGSAALLLEPASTNLITNNASLESTLGAGADWSLSVSTAVTGMYFGSQIVRHAQAGTDSDTDAGYNNFGATAGSTYALSAWIHLPAGHPFTALAFRGDGWSSITQLQTVNLSLTNVWQKISAIAVAGAGAPMILSATSSNSSGYFYSTCWQAELGGEPTSFIPTGGVAASRASDILSATLGASFTQMAGTLLAEAVAPTSGVGAAAATLTLQNQAAPSDYVQLALGGWSASAGLSASGAVTSLGTTSVANGATARQAVSWSDSQAQRAINGNIQNTAQGTGPATNLNSIAFSILQPLYLRRLALYPYARTGNDLAAISATTFDPTTEGGSGATYTIANLAQPLPVPPLTGAVYILQDATLTATEWQVVGISETSRGIFEIVAAAYNPDKFALVEDVPTLTIPVFSTVPAQLASALPAPTNVSAITTLSGLGVTTMTMTVVSWTPPVDSRIVAFQVSVVNSEGTTVAVLTPSGASTVIDNLAPDTYYFSVRSLGANGSTSAWAYSAATVVTGTSNNPPPAATGLTAIGGNRSVYLQWTSSTQRDVAYYNMWRSSTLLAPHQPGSIAALIGTTAGTTFTDADSQTLTPGTYWYYWVEPVTTTEVVGELSVDVLVAISYIATEDIGNGAIALIDQFAAHFQPIGIWTAGTLPTSTGETDGATTIIWTSNYQLYTWNATLNQFVAATPTASTLQGTLTASQIASINTAQLTGTLTTTQIGTGTIQTGNLAAASVNTAALAAGSVTTLNLAAGAVTAQNIAANSITTGQLAAGTLSASNITAGVLNAGVVLASLANFGTVQITSAYIASLTVQTSNLANNSVTAAYSAANGGGGPGTQTLATSISAAVVGSTVLINFYAIVSFFYIQGYSPDSGNDSYSGPSSASVTITGSNGFSQSQAFTQIGNNVSGNFIDNTNSNGTVTYTATLSGDGGYTVIYAIYLTAEVFKK